MWIFNRKDIKMSSVNNFIVTSDSANPTYRDESKKMDPASILPDELIISIFSHLTLLDLGRC